MSRTEPNPNRLFESSVEPNRTLTDFLKIQSNRTELEPEKFGSIRSLIDYGYTARDEQTDKLLSPNTTFIIIIIILSQI
jgi:hypothetical protein